MKKEELDKLNKEFYGFTMKEVDDNLGEYVLKYNDLRDEKQKLISWLEDRIKDIKTILTKEQFERYCYKVGD